MEVVIGLDFGTRFSKVAYRIEGADRIGIFTDPQSGPFIESIVWLSPTSTVVHRKRPESGGADLVPILFLKLLLKSPDRVSELLGGVAASFVNRDTLPALAAFYLTGVLQGALEFFEKSEGERLKGNPPSFALNLSIPAQYCDDAASQVFSEVGAVALRWAQAGVENPAKLGDLVRKFESEKQLARSGAVIGVVPEVVAALSQFMKRRDTPPGVYGFLDVGAGTIDACIFRLTRSRPTPLVPLLSAKVEDLGSAVLARRAVADANVINLLDVERLIISSDDPPTDLSRKLDSSALAVSNFVGDLLASARDKMRGYRLVHDPADLYDNRSEERALDGVFDILVSGGGAQSKWYRTRVCETYSARRLRNLGIMAYRWRILEPSQGDSIPFPYGRLVIALGLTEAIENLDNIKILLPSQIKPPPGLPTRESTPHVYED